MLAISSSSSAAAASRRLVAAAAAVQWRTTGVAAGAGSVCRRHAGSSSSRRWLTSSSSKPTTTGPPPPPTTTAQQQHPGVGKLVRRKRKATTTPGEATSQRQPQSQQQGSRHSNITDYDKLNPELIDGTPDAMTTVSRETQLKNLGLATLLVGFVCGVGYYSVMAVGEAGSGGSDDPLALLKEEARPALDKKRAEEKELKESQQLMEEFNRGAYDPDAFGNYVDEDDENGDGADKNNKKRPWWKFW